MSTPTNSREFTRLNDRLCRAAVELSRAMLALSEFHIRTGFSLRDVAPADVRRRLRDARLDQAEKWRQAADEIPID